MGTFHQNLGELHGMTVVVDMLDDHIYVGRCHEANEHKVVLLDVDQHRDGDKEMTKQDYIQQAAKWGVFKKFDNLVLLREKVASITLLNQANTG